MSGFKLLAIRTGSLEISPTTFLKTKSSKVQVDWLKILNENTVYAFSSNFNYPNNDFKKIEKVTDSLDIFSVRLNNHRLFPINAHAIVGENGTGKSTLVELIYWMNFNLGTIGKHLKTDDGEIYEINNGFNAEIFYQAAENHFKLNFENGRIQQTEVKFTDNSYIEYPNSTFQTIWQFQDLKEFFYTVVINYSQHSLNALEIGDWIDPLFHKNDAYQTPIVINPQRHNGNININRERQLLTRRLQSNVLEKYSGKIEESLRNLANGKIAEKIDVVYNQKYFDKETKSLKKLTLKPFKTLANCLTELYGVDFSNDDLDVLFSTHIRFENGEDTFDDKEKVFKRVLITYIFCKLKKLVHLYDDYKPYQASFPTQIKKILLKILSSDSHLVFKVKGAILHLKYFKVIYPTKEWKIFSDLFSLSISKFSNVIHDEIIPKEKFYINTFMMAMPSFWNVHIIPSENNLISQFSSGEKQRIYSISSIIYHIINLNSVEENKTIKEYKYINLILDEIELYYHPEWQRRFLHDLLTYIEKINPQDLKNIEGLNILFVTHSPFILSDIPSNNVLKLGIKNNKTVAIVNERESFGANIHNLLANDFFLENGFMGEFAKEKINEIITFLNYKQIEEKLSVLDKKKDKSEISKLENQMKELENKNSDLTFDNCQERILLIGEPVIRETLLRQHFNIISTDKTKSNNFFERLAKELNYDISKKQ